MLLAYLNCCPFEIKSRKLSKNSQQKLSTHCVFTLLEVISAFISWVFRYFVSFIFFSFQRDFFKLLIGISVFRLSRAQRFCFSLTFTFLFKLSSCYLSEFHFNYSILLCAKCVFLHFSSLDSAYKVDVVPFFHETTVRMNE